MKKSASRRRTNLSSRATPLAPSPRKSSTSTPVRRLGSCSLQRRARSLRSDFRSQTPSISQGLILFPRSERPFLNPRSIDIFRRQNRRIWLTKPQEIASLKVSMLRGSVFTRSLLGKSIRPRFCKPLNVTKGPSLVTLFGAQGLHGILPGRAAGGQQAGNDRQ